MKKVIGILVFCILIGDLTKAFCEVINLDNIVITATRIEQLDYRITGNVTIITKEEIESSGSRSIPDALKQALGINIYNNGSTKSSVVDIRGFGDTASRNVLVLVNDRKVNTADISPADLIQIPIEAVEQIEIIRGAGSVLYGDNAVGGVINIITKQGKGEISGYLGAHYGSYDTVGEDIEVSGSTDNFSYYVHSKYLDQGGYRENSDSMAHDHNARVTYELSDHVSFDLNYGYHEDNQELPGGLLDAALETMGRKATTNPDDYSKTEDQFVQLGLEVNPWSEDLDFGHFVIDLFYRDREVFDSFNSFGAFNTMRDIKTKGITGKYIFDRTIFDHEVNFVTGIDYYDYENDILGVVGNVDDITITKEELGVYGFLEFEMFEDVFFNGGTRYHQAEYDFDQRNVIVKDSRRPDEWVTMGGMKYEYNKGSNIFFNIQKTFRFLATDEWYSTANFPGFGITPGLNLDLEHQTGKQFEMGIKHNYKDKIEVSITPYYIRIKDEIFFDPVTFANDNYDETRRIGIEFFQSTDLLKFFESEFLNTLEYFTGYTYQHAEFNEGANDGKKIPFVPEHQVSTGLRAAFLEFFNATLTANFVGSRFAINDTMNITSPIKPYFVVDGKLSYNREHYEVFIAVNNLFDEKYDTYTSKSTSSSTKSHFPAPERNFNVGMKLKF